MKTSEAHPQGSLLYRRWRDVGTTGAEGRIVLRRPRALFEPGTTWLFQSAYDTAWVPLSTEPLRLERGATVELVLQRAAPRVLRGTVLDPNGEPLAGAHVRFVYDRDGERVLCSTKSRREGAFRLFAEDPRAHGTLVVEHPHGEAGPRFVPHLTAGGPEQTLRLPSPDPVRLGVVGARGERVVPSSVEMTWTVEGHSVRSERPRNSREQEGAYLVRPAVPFSLFIRARDHQAGVFGPFVPEDVHDVLCLELVPLPPIRGTVTHKGQPVDARVWSIRIADEAPPAVELLPPAFGFGLEVRDGVLKTSHRFATASTYDIFAWNAELGSGRLLGVRIDPAVGVEGLRIELDTPPGCIEGRVLVPEGRAVDRLLLCGPGGLMAVRPDGTFRLPRCRAGPGQVRVIEGYESSRLKNLEERLTGLLQEERYILYSHPPTDGPDWLPFQPSFAVDVPAGATSRLEIDLRHPLPYRVKGRIHIDGRTPRFKEPMGYGSKLPMVAIDPGKERVDLGPLDQDFPWISRADLDSDGTFEVGAETPGTYRLMCRLTLDDGTVWNIVDRVDVQERETTWAKDLRTGRFIAGKRDWEGWRWHRLRWADAGSELRVFAWVRGDEPVTVPAGVVQEIVDHEGERTILSTHDVVPGRTTEARPGDRR